MRQHWITLSKMLWAILKAMPQRGERFLTLVARYHNALERRTLLDNRSDSGIHDWVVCQFDLITLRARFPFAMHAIIPRQSAMLTIIRRFAAFHGLPSGVHFLTALKSDLQKAGLTALYEKGLAIIRPRGEEAAEASQSKSKSKSSVINEAMADE